MPDSLSSVDQVWFAFALVLVVAFFFTVGVITSMRWVGRTLSAWGESARYRRRVRRYDKKHPLVATPAKPFVPRKAYNPAHPMRHEPGPRDWTPTGGL